MPDHIADIPIEELQILEGDELIFDGSDPSTYIVIEPGTSIADIIAALDWDRPPARPGENTAPGGDAGSALEGRAPADRSTTS
jgi:hypothetical protein